MIETWLFYTLISALFSGFVSILHRFILRDHDYISYGFLWNIFTALLFIPLFTVDFVVPSNTYAWVIAGIGVFLWTIIGLTGFKATQLTEISLKEPLSHVRLIFLLIFSYFLISEALTFHKTFGTILIFFGMILLTYKRGKLFGRLSDIGVRLTLFTSFLMALVSVVDKVALKYWSVSTYAFVAFLIPGLILGAITVKRMDRFVKLIKSKLLLLVLTSILGVGVAYFQFSAYKLTDVSNVFPVFRLSTLVATVGGIILLKEKKDILQKIVGAIIMIIGVIFISGYW